MHQRGWIRSPGLRECKVKASVPPGGAEDTSQPGPLATTGRSRARPVDCEATSKGTGGAAGRHKASTMEPFPSRRCEDRRGRCGTDAA